MHRYFIFHKPYEVLSQFSPEEGKKTLADYLPGIPKNIYPVGRLDHDSEGLLVLTDDKRLTSHLLEPRNKHQRTYWVQVEGVPAEEAIRQLSAGVKINIKGKEHQTAPALVSLLDPEPVVPDRHPPIRYRKNIPTSWLSLTLTEGKNRQVRRMTAATGYPTLRLIRFSIGKITLDDLEPGSVRELQNGEWKQLLNS